MNTAQVAERPSVDIGLPNTSPETSSIRLVSEMPHETAKLGMTKAFAIVASAALLVFAFTAVLIWFASGGDLAGTVGVGLFAAFWGGLGFGSMVVAVSRSDN